MLSTLPKTLISIASLLYFRERHEHSIFTGLVHTTNTLERILSGDDDTELAIIAEQVRDFFLKNTHLFPHLS